jgi:membrane-anchored protein YejM (alkaline phosphatase superfamily)
LEKAGRFRAGDRRFLKVGKGRSMTRLRTLNYFILANFWLALVNASPYLGFGPGIGDPVSWFYTRMAFASTFALHFVALTLILIPFTLFFRSPAQLYILPPLLMTAYHTFVFLDVHIYKMFRFHINGLVMNILSTEGSKDSIELGTGTVLTFFAFLAAVWILEIACVYALRSVGRRAGSRMLLGPVFQKVPAVVLIFLLTLSVAEKAIFAYASFNNETQITRYKRLFPLYLPITANSMLDGYLGHGREALEADIPTGSSLLNYPARKVDLREGLKPVNMVWIVVESWRFDAMNPENTPNIWKFAQKSLVFDDHYSGGNASRFGGFSLLYGLYAPYWHQFLAERRSSVFIDTLQSLNYEFNIMASAKLTYPEFRKTAFRNLPVDSIHDDWPVDSPPERDALFPETLNRFLDGRNAGRPFFSFMWVNSSHSPYRFPEAYDHYHAKSEAMNYLESDFSKKEVRTFYNRYRNSVYYEDEVIGRILRLLEDRKLLDSTVVLITGDHGEEFRETGYLGHNSAFTKYQVRVPFILSIPGRGHEVIDRPTSHVDVVPTLFALMGSRVDSSAYSNGRSLLDPADAPFVVVGSWNTFAIIDPKATIVFPTEIYNTSPAEVRLESYREADDPKPLLAARENHILEVARDLRRFLR